MDRQSLFTKIVPRVLLTLLAQSSGDLTTSTVEWELPVTWHDAVPVILLLIALATTVWFTYRDTRQLNRGWGWLLGGFRCALLIAALIIALNPHERTQTEAYRDSRVVLLVDTSQSMQQPESAARPTPGELARSRAKAVRELLQDSDLLDRLREQHVVDLYTFDSSLSPLRVRLPSRFSSSEVVGNKPADSAGASGNSEEADGNGPEPFNWDELIEAAGLSTRLGDALDTLLVEARSPTLSGVVVISDGAANAGRETLAARERAEEQGIRLITVGVGSTEPPVNLEVARLIAPSDVQKGDAFELSALLRGQGVAGQNVLVDLLQKGPTDTEPRVVYTQELTITEENPLAEILFDRLQPATAGAFEYTVRARLASGVETREDDNQQTKTVNIFDRPFRVLIMAGGPMRDYRFATVAMNRHPSVLADVWLQTGEVGISQQANQQLFRFPETIEELYEYDVILAFDPDWSRIEPELIERLSNWISDEGGGMIAIAGDVYTPQLALESNPQLAPIRRLYPVLLETLAPRLNQERAETPFPLDFTQEGSSAEFLDLEAQQDHPAWDDFPGVFRTYPTRGAKAGTTVYAEFSDPLSRGSGGQPIVLAGQRFGQGQILYVGSPELWRLRALDEAYLDRFWLKMIRKAAEGRSKRGLQRGMFILDGREFPLGQTITLRLRALNTQFQPLETDQVRVEAYRSDGVPLVPALELRRDPLRPAEFVGDFRPLVPGRYRLEFDIPDSNDRVTTEIDIQMPRQEAASLVQNQNLLERLVDGTGGAYLPITQAAAGIPDLLPNQGERMVIDQQIRELWDRQWLLLLLALLLTGEWLARKLLKLA